MKEAKRNKEWDPTNGNVKKVYAKDKKRENI